MGDNECDTTMDDSVAHLPGHIFLAKMGKKLLRPGGRRATETLFELASLQPGERVCEIATNRAITAIELATRFGANVEGVDASPEFLTIARRNVADRGLEDRIKLHLCKGNQLPLEDRSIDAVIAEAVITMLPPAQKAETIREAARVLKPNGRLVFHELARDEESDEMIRKELARSIRHPAWPLTVDEWRRLVEEAGLTAGRARTGPMSLMTPGGLLRDEGIGGVARIMWNVWRTPGARRRFREMSAFFRHHRPELKYIVLRADKPSQVNGPH